MNQDEAVIFALKYDNTPDGDGIYPEDVTLEDMGGGVFKVMWRAVDERWRRLAPRAMLAVHGPDGKWIPSAVLA